MSQPPPDRSPEPPRATVTDPRIEEIVRICLRAADGDLEARIVGMAGETSDLAPLVQAINAMLDMADSFVRETAAATSAFGAGEFHRPILLRGLKGAYRESAVIINQAGMTMRNDSESLNLVARLAADNSAMVSHVAAACDELNASGGQISEQAQEVKAASEGSLRESNEALEKTRVLEEAFQRIQSITSLILKISEKTHLLALNASIESARAGEHGTRFGVIAREIKDLSRNTSEATEDITVQVSRLRESVEDVGRLIHMIHGSITATQDRMATIAASTAAQVAATDKINQQINDLTANSQAVADQIGKKQRAEG